MRQILHSRRWNYRPLYRRRGKFIHSKLPTQHCWTCAKWQFTTNWIRFAKKHIIIVSSSVEALSVIDTEQVWIRLINGRGLFCCKSGVLYKRHRRWGENEEPGSSKATNWHVKSRLIFQCRWSTPEAPLVWTMALLSRKCNWELSDSLHQDIQFRQPLNYEIESSATTTQ